MQDPLSHWGERIAIKGSPPQFTTANVGGLLTHTGESISTVAIITGTGEATMGVGTDSISVTYISTTTCIVIVY